MAAGAPPAVPPEKPRLGRNVFALAAVSFLFGALVALAAAAGLAMVVPGRRVAAA